MIRRFGLSGLIALVITALIVVCQIPLFLNESAKNTYYNKQALLSFQVVNKDKASFDFEARRVKFYPLDKAGNLLSATSKMTYINRKRSIHLAINSEQQGNNDILFSFASPILSVNGNENPAQISYSNIMINGKLIQKEILTSSQNPYHYILHNIPNQESISISFQGKKPFSFMDLNLLQIAILFVLIFLIISYRKNLYRFCMIAFAKMQKNTVFQKLISVFHSFFYQFSYWKMLLILGVFFVLFALIYMQTPFHSDDWVQMDCGVSISQIYEVWMTHSGRLVADIMARSFLLLNQNRLLLAILLALVPILTCALITVIPSLITKNKPEPITFCLVIFLYWICNPNLGQTTFWVVGMSNYLWTCLMVLIFFFTYLIGYQKSTGTYRILLFALGLCAGCSNEHTALTLPFVLLGAGYLLKKQYPNMKATNTYIGILSCLLGGGILMGAPGNFERLKTETETLSIVRKIGKGIERLLRHFISFGFIFVLLGMTSVWNRHDFKIQSKKPQPFLWGILFTFAACMAAGVMIFSPSASARTFNNSLIFFLLGLSFMIQSVSQQGIKAQALKIGTFFLCGGIFIYSYLCVFYSYRATNQQQQIRIFMIKKEKAKGKQDIIIPDFYFPKLRTVNDKFDTYHNPLGMALHFGVRHIFLNQNVNFDYGTLLTGHWIHSPVEDVFIVANSSNFIADGTIIVGTQNPDKHIDKCVLKVKGKVFNLPPSVSLSDKIITGISVYQYDAEEDPISLDCPFSE